jgi:signal peptidase II
MDRVEAMGRTAEEHGPSASTHEGGKYLWVASVALAIVLLDQVTKLWIAASMRLHQSIPIIEGFFDLTYVRNTGAAFSMFAGHSATFRVPFFVIVSTVAVVVILSFVRSTPANQKAALLGCAFVLGGAVGNLIDRIAYGEVIDFLDVYYRGWHWPAFNVADTFISTGVILLLIRGVFTRDDHPESD